MRAFRLKRFGDEPALTTVPRRPPEAGEVELEVAACGLNFADLLTIRGAYQDMPEPPLTLGMEVAGRVVAVGDGVSDLAPGDRVAAVPGSGGLADRVTLPAGACLRLPEAMPFTDAAAFQIAYGSSHLALARRAGLRRGETVLVLGASGGVGLTAVEIAARMGARVVAVARGAEKRRVAVEAGAHETIDSEADDHKAAFKALGGIDVVYDAVGEPLFTPALRACAPEARYLVIGFAAGEVPRIPANILLVKNVTVHGFYWGGYRRFAPDAVTDSLRTLLAWYAEGGLRPHVSHVLPLERAAEGLQLLRDRRATGKVVITP